MGEKNSTKPKKMWNIRSGKTENIDLILDLHPDFPAEERHLSVTFIEMFVTVRKKWIIDGAAGKELLSPRTTVGSLEACRRIWRGRRRVIKTTVQQIRQAFHQLMALQIQNPFVFNNFLLTLHIAGSFSSLKSNLECHSLRDNFLYHPVSSSSTQLLCVTSHYFFP